MLPVRSYSVRLKRRNLATEESFRKNLHRRKVGVTLSNASSSTAGTDSVPGTPRKTTGASASVPGTLALAPVVLRGVPGTLSVPAVELDALLNVTPTFLRCKFFLNDSSVAKFRLFNLTLYDRTGNIVNTFSYYYSIAISSFNSTFVADLI